MDEDKAIRAAKLTLGGMLEKKRAKSAVERAQGQIAPSKYLPGVPRAVHAAGGYVPQASLPVSRVAIAKPGSYGQQPTAIDALSSLASIGSTVKGFSDTVEGEEAPTGGGHHPNDGHDHSNMSEAALAAWGKLTDAYGQPLTVTSAYRDPKRNESVGGAGNSQHMHGNAYDIDTSGMSYEDRLALADMAWNSGFRGVGFYDNSLHFDVGDPRSWGPSYSRDSIPEWALPWAQERYGYADGGPVADLGQAREQKQLQTFSNNMRSDIHQRASNAMAAHQKAVDAGVFDGYEVGDTLQGSAHPMRITGRFVRKWKPTPMTLQSFDRMGTKPTIVEHEGEQYIPMLRYQTGKEGVDGFQEGDAYLDGVKAAGYQKMGGLRSVKAAGGAAMFEGIHPDLQDESGNPKDLYHGTPGAGFEAFDDAKLGNRDAGFYGRGHYLTPIKGNAEGYADPDEMGAGTVMGPLHAALKNPYIWDTSDAGSHRTLRDLQSMGIMKGQGKLEPWDNLQRHHIDPFMREMKTRGHDGVLVKGDNGLSEVVVFKPNMIKHRDAEVFDPNDPRIMRAEGGEVDDPVNFGTARLMRNFNQNSTGPTPAAEGVFNRIEDRYQKSKMAYDAAHADGVFDSVQIGDVYKYKPLPNSSPMEVVGHRMMPVERWGGEKPPKYVYHDHYPVVDLKGGGETKPYSVERMEDRDLYDRVKGRPRIVKAGGGNVDKALAITRGFTKDGRAATMQLKAKGD